MIKAFGDEHKMSQGQTDLERHLELLLLLIFCFANEPNPFYSSTLKMLKINLKLKIDLVFAIHYRDNQA